MTLDVSIAWAVAIALRTPIKRAELDKPDINLLTNYLEQCRRFSVSKRFKPTFTEAQMKRVHYIARRYGFLPDIAT